MLVNIRCSCEVMVMKRTAVCALIFVMFSMVGGGVLAQDLERLSGENTEWWCYGSASPETIRTALDEHEARLIDLEVTSTSPLRFSAVMIRNSGSYASESWWYYGMDGDRVSALLGELTARILDLEVYYDDGQLRFAVILVPNTGSQARTWWWYYNANADAFSDLAAQHNARLVDLEVQKESGEPLYAFVMISNTGSDEASWSWYPGISPSDLTDVLSTTPVRILDLERMSDGRFAVVLLRRQGVPWWWWYGLNRLNISDVVNLTEGGRVVDIEQYNQGGGPRYAAVLTGNVDNTESKPVRVSFPIDIVLTTTSDWTDVAFVGGTVVVYDQEVLMGASADRLEVLPLSVEQSCCDTSPVRVLFHAYLVDPSEWMEVQIEKGHIGETAVALYVPGETDPMATYKHAGVADASDPGNTRTFTAYCAYLVSNLTWVIGISSEERELLDP
jgi:hypothetical protein